MVASCVSSSKSWKSLLLALALLQQIAPPDTLSPVSVLSIKSTPLKSCDSEH